MANHLTIIANKWKEADETADLPEVLYDALVGENNTAYERRVVKAMAKASRIIRDDGSIRPYSEFSKDWEYNRSVYGETSVCQACGKKDIVQNCILKNKDDSSEIIVGSTCVFRYIEIVIDGRVLEGDEKEEWLRIEMNGAKREFRRQMFLSRFPNVMDDLEKYEPLRHNYNRWGMAVKYTRRVNQVDKLMSSMAKRMAKFGYPGPQLESRWVRFMDTADERLADHNRFIEEARAEYDERKKKHDRLRSEREARWESEREKREQEREEKADTFLKETQPLVSTMNQWETTKRDEIANRIRKGIPLGGFFNIVREWNERVKVMNGGEVAHPAHARLKNMDESRLNDWEKKFRVSVMQRLEGGRDLTEKQAKAIERIAAKFTPSE